MSLLDNLANMLKAGAGMKRTINLTGPSGTTALPPEMVNTRNGHGQQPYAYYSQAHKTPRDLRTLIAQAGQLHQLRPMPMQQPQNQAEFSNLQGQENPGLIPLQNSGHLRQLQDQGYWNNLQGY